MLDIAEALVWSAWQPLAGCWRGETMPNRPGLYRIRRIGGEAIDYIGQTGSGTMTLRRRLAMLAGVYAASMPYRDPHTAGPALWALRQATGADFEASVAVVEGAVPWRKALEAVAIGLYRQQHHCSPTVNFGRMPEGYRMSSANNARLVASGMRVRGRLTNERDASHTHGITPPGGLDGDPTGDCWCGHDWTAWVPLSAARQCLKASDIGLYRIYTPDAAALVYVGQGRLLQRMSAHAARAAAAEDEQGRVFAAGQPLDCSWVTEPLITTHQLLELENDLIAAHTITLGRPPAAQFLG